MIFCFVIHFLFLFVLAFFKKTGKLRCSVSMLILAALIPVFGFLCIISVQRKLKGKHNRVDVAEINHMKIEDDIYRSIHIKPDDGVKETVPVEESLLFNSAIKRRKLLLNVLSLKASDYVSALRNAGVNDDTEVVHYAVTALVELRKDYNQRMEQMDRRMAATGGNRDVVREYINLLEEYIASGLPEKEEYREKLLFYEQLLKDAATDSRSARESIYLLHKRVDCALVREDYDHAAALAERLISMEPEREDGYLLKIKCCSAAKDRQGIDSVIQRLFTNHVFLSEEGEKLLAFWQPVEVRS